MRNAIVTLALAFLPWVFQQSTPGPMPPAPAQSADKAAAKPDAATPADTPAQSAQGMSTCYLYRPRLYRGSAVRIGIFIDGAMAANLVNGRWVSLQVPAGHHVVKPKDDQSGIEIDMEPGQSYYFRSGWGEQGFFHGAHKQLMLMMKEQGAYEIKQLKPLEEKDISWGKSSAPTLK
jgi:Protein of unknown function (DUF2846)